MRVLVTGGTGFVGPGVVRELLARGHEVTLLVHRSPGPFTGDEKGLRLQRGEVLDPESLRRAAAGSEAVVHLVGLRREAPRRGLTFERLHVEATRHALEAAKAAGARRFLHMSASGVERRRTGYQRTKSEAEDLVRAAGLEWTIFRPTLVTGPAEGHAGGFDHEMADLVRRAPFAPSFAGGRFTVQPVAKRDVGLAFARALEEPRSVGKVYVLAGPDRLTWDDYLRALCEALGRRRLLAPLPRGLVLAAAGLLGGFAWLPATREELEMLFEGVEGDASEAARDLGIAFSGYRRALAEALANPPRAPPRRAA